MLLCIYKLQSKQRNDKWREEIIVVLYVDQTH